MTPPVGDIKTLARLSAAFLVMVAAVAAITSLWAGGAARALLGFGFGHVRRDAAAALSIFLNNLELLCVPLAMATVVQARHQLERQQARQRYVLFCDVVAIAPAIKNAVIVGISVGAYGSRMVLATLPAGPVEIVSFALAANVYLASRNAPKPSAGRRLARPAVAAIGLLAAAALLEALS
jgi:hypothetical protein